ncbi:hypothetical protein TNCV_265191 [Trichonephila clavipes]|nr:hypothetical protein TNCV_265191 [Trichonephila clavipes]
MSHPPEVAKRTCCQTRPAKKYENGSQTYTCLVEVLQPWCVCRATDGSVIAGSSAARAVRSVSWNSFRGSVVVVHEEPHPQMTGTLSYRPEETGGRQREKLDTRHRRLDDRYRVLPWPEDCTVVCLHDALYVCTFNACPSEKAFFCREHRNWRDNEWGPVLFTDTDSV